MPNRNASPTYCWATPFTRLRKENSFGEYDKLKFSLVVVKVSYLYYSLKIFQKGEFMKKIIVFVLTIFILFSGFATQSYALSDSKSAAIQALLDDACRISGVPGMSISILADDEVFYFSSGYADREKELFASENTLYELASVSKAFTGMGILLLEEQGLLSMTDPVQKYLPWFTLKYQGKPVDMQSLTLNNFLHHTSGLTIL